MEVDPPPLPRREPRTKKGVQLDKVPEETQDPTPEKPMEVVPEEHDCQC